MCRRLFLVADEKSNVLTKQVSPKLAIVIAVSALVVIAAVWWGPGLFRKLTDRPPTSAEVHSTLWSYLHKRTGEKDFSVDLSSLTNETSEAAADAGSAPQKKRKKASSPRSVYARYFKQKQDEAGTYKDVYKLIGQELKLAETFLAKPEPEHKEMALALISDASRFANDPAGDPWLGARICEGYLWANLGVAESLPKSDVSAERILMVCENAFKDAGETNNVVQNYKFLIAKSSGTQTDISRFRLARVLEEQGEYAEALSYLKQVTATNKNGLPQRIAALEQKLKAARK
jgi:hypothetical protein